MSNFGFLCEISEYAMFAPAALIGVINAVRDNAVDVS